MPGYACSALVYITVARSRVVLHNLYLLYLCKHMTAQAFMLSTLQEVEGSVLKIREVLVVSFARAGALHAFRLQIHQILDVETERVLHNRRWGWGGGGAYPWPCAFVVQISSVGHLRHTDQHDYLPVVGPQFVDAVIPDRARHWDERDRDRVSKQAHVCANVCG